MVLSISSFAEPIACSGSESITFESRSRCCRMEDASGRVASDSCEMPRAVRAMVRPCGSRRNPSRRRNFSIPSTASAAPLVAKYCSAVSNTRSIRAVSASEFQSTRVSVCANSAGEPYSNEIIVETHGEYLIYRLQKLIRNGQLKPGDVSVLYFLKDDYGTLCFPLRLDEKGRFLDPWPKGFFEEGYKELFD